MTAHTDGPWFAHADGTTVEAMKGVYRRTLVSINYDGNDERQRANAHLVAAAPDLLEAARKALASLQAWHDVAASPCSCFDCTDTVPALEAAIAQAEGRSDGR